MHGPWLNTLQKDGVQGLPSSTLQGSCENGIGSICRGRASAVAATARAATATMKPIATRDSMQRHLARDHERMMAPADGIKPTLVHIRAFTANSESSLERFPSRPKSRPRSWPRPDSTFPGELV